MARLVRFNCYKLIGAETSVAYSRRAFAIPVPWPKH